MKKNIIIITVSSVVFVLAGYVFLRYTGIETPDLSQGGVPWGQVQCEDDRGKVGSVVAETFKDDTLYVAGNFEGILDFGTIGQSTSEPSLEEDFEYTSPSGEDFQGAITTRRNALYVTRYDQGFVRWVSEIYPDTLADISSITSDSMGNIYIGGYFSREIDFGQGNVLTSEGGRFHDGFVAKYSPDGIIQWASVIDSTNFTAILDIVVDENDQVYAVGSFQGSLMVDDQIALQTTDDRDNMGMIFSFAPDGDIRWVRQVGGQSTSRGIDHWIQLHDGNVYVLTGWEGRRKVVRYSPEADEEVVFGLDDIFMSGGGFDMDEQGNFYILVNFMEIEGSRGAPVQLAPNTLVEGEVRNNTLLIKYSPTGEFQWHDAISGVWGDSLAVNSQTQDILVHGTIKPTSHGTPDLELEGGSSDYWSHSVIIPYRDGERQLAVAIPGIDTSAVLIARDQTQYVVGVAHPPESSSYYTESVDPHTEKCPAVPQLSRIRNFSEIDEFAGDSLLWMFP